MGNMKEDLLVSEKDKFDIWKMEASMRALDDLTEDEQNCVETVVYVSSFFSAGADSARSETLRAVMAWMTRHDLKDLADLTAKTFACKPLRIKKKK
jgi:hypothetical protein